MEEEHQIECRANTDYEAYRARGVMKDGRRFGKPPTPFEPPATPAGKINLTDLDSRNVKTSRGWVQGYNAQAVTTEDQIVIAADVNVDSTDSDTSSRSSRQRARSSSALASSSRPGSCSRTPAIGHHVQMERLAAEGTAVLVPPDAKKPGGARPGWDGGIYAFMRRVLATDHGGCLYAKRQVMVEPVFADTKFNRRIDRFYGAAEPPRGRNGGSPPPPTTS